MTLWDKFMNAYMDGRTWRIYEKGTRKLLCKDYGSLKNDDTHLDDRIFVKAELKVNKYGDKYLRIVVE